MQRAVRDPRAECAFSPEIQANRGLRFEAFVLVTTPRPTRAPHPAQRSIESDAEEKPPRACARSVIEEDVSPDARHDRPWVARRAPTKTDFGRRREATFAFEGDDARADAERDAERRALRLHERAVEDAEGDAFVNDDADLRNEAMAGNAPTSAHVTIAVERDAHRPKQRRAAIVRGRDDACGRQHAGGEAIKDVCALFPCVPHPGDRRDDVGQCRIFVPRREIRALVRPLRVRTRRRGEHAGERGADDERAHRTNQGERSDARASSIFSSISRWKRSGADRRSEDAR